MFAKLFIKRVFERADSELRDDGYPLLAEAIWNESMRSRVSDAREDAIELYADEPDPASRAIEHLAGELKVLALRAEIGRIEG